VSGHSFVRKWVLLCAPADKDEEEVRFSLISTSQLLRSSFAVNQQKGVETAHLSSFFFLKGEGGSKKPRGGDTPAVRSLE